MSNKNKGRRPDQDKKPKYVDNRPKIINDGGNSVSYLQVNENTRFVTDIETADAISSEANGRLSYFICGGVDANLFEIDQRSGQVFFKAAPDYEQPRDYNRNNGYEVAVKVVDGAGYWDTQLLRIAVRDVNEQPLEIVGTAGDDSLIGTAGNDTIRGEGGLDFADGLGGDDLLIGGAGNDVLVGGDGKDRLNGTDSTARGVNEVDNLNGNAGADTFILGDTSGSFYVGNNFSDFAIINDFTLGEDQIVLSGSASQYSVADGSDGNAFILYNTGSGTDAIAQLVGRSSASIDINQFQFVH
jgi:Ca2+-binding RTX toxin-like protein